MNDCFAIRKKYDVRIGLLLMFLSVPILLLAQPEKKLQAEKVAFFTREIGLTPREAQDFWPVYNEYERKRQVINRERKIITAKYIRNKASLSDKEIQIILDRYIKFEQQETALLTNYTKRFSAILPPEKVMQIFIAEIEFRKYLLSLLREQKVNMGIRENR